MRRAAACACQTAARPRIRPSTLNESVHMRIECKTTFRDGPETFEAGDIRTVSDERAYGFIALGWAAKVGEAAVPMSSGTVTLDVHNSTLGMGDSNG